MQIDIRGQNLELTDVERDHIMKRVEFAVGHVKNQVRKVMVRVSDQNGPKGGDDKRCKVVAEMLPSGSVVVEDDAAELLVAVDRAADRLGHAVEREADRQQSFDRQSPRTRPEVY